MSDALHDDDGVDLTVIRWFLGLSAEERLAYADEWRAMSVALMEAYREQHLRAHPGGAD